LAVVTAQTAELNNESTALNILSTRLTDSVTLIEALGGSWNVSQLPSD
jgi:outer membrane protein TolC